MTITADIQTLAPSAIIELFEVDVTPLGGDLLRFHAGTNGLQQSVVWQGNTYQPMPIQVDGFGHNGQGQLPRPTITIANVTGLISALLLQYDDLAGVKVTRHRTLAKYLDATNFSGGNPSADPTVEFPLDIFFIDRKASETKTQVQFELSAAFDVAGVQLPRRQIIQNICTWQYKSPECGYTGTNYFKADDTATTDPTQDKCGKRLSSCKCRFGQYAELPYGGYPAAGLVRQ